MHSNCQPPCGRISRRTFFSDLGWGTAGLAAGSLLAGDGIVRAEEPQYSDRGLPMLRPRARSVIWVFLSGGYSHLETFDPKPALNKYAGKTFSDTGYPDPFKDERYRQRSRSVVNVNREHARIFPLQIGYRQHGQSGIEITDWWPHLATCVDDIAFVRSMYTTDNDHAAEFQMHHGRHKLDEKQPVIGSWISYGLGSLNENLPEFVFLGKYSDQRVKENFSADYLGPMYGGVELSLNADEPLPFGARPKDVLAVEQESQFAFIDKLNRISAIEYPDDETLRARIKAYELAFRMQTSVPETLDLTAETEETQQLYGIDDELTEIYGRRLLAARRLAERGVRFTLVYLSDYGEWDSHQKLRKKHSQSCRRVDKPLAGLLKDLKRRGMSEETVVVCCTEFGRTPGVEVREGGSNLSGRDHHPHGFTIWFAGAGIQGGSVHGATDELGFHAVESPHYVTDIHATVLQLMGLDSRRLNIPGHKRLEIDYGRPIDAIVA